MNIYDVFELFSAETEAAILEMKRSTEIDGILLVACVERALKNGVVHRTNKGRLLTNSTAIVAHLLEDDVVTSWLHYEDRTTLVAELRAFPSGRRLLDQLIEQLTVMIAAMK